MLMEINFSISMKSFIEIVWVKMKQYEFEMFPKMFVNTAPEDLFRTIVIASAMFTKHQ